MVIDVSYVGEDIVGRKVYVDRKTDQYYKDTGAGVIFTVEGGFEGDPVAPIKKDTVLNIL